MKTIGIVIAFFLIFITNHSSMAAIDISSQHYIECSIDYPHSLTLTGLNISQSVKIYLVPKNQSATIGRLKSKGNTLDIAIQDNIAYIADGIGDLRLVNIQEPSKPYEFSSIKTNPMALGVTLSDEKKVYIASYYGGVHTIDISNTNPELISNPKVSNGRIIKTALIDTKTLCLATEKGMKILDVSNPFEYMEIGQYDINTQSVSVIVRDYIAVLSLREKGFDLLNIENRYSPQLIKHVAIPAMGTLFSDNKLFVVNESAELHIFELSESEELKEINTWKTNGSATHLDIQNNMLCIAYFNGIECIDISNIHDLKTICNYTMPAPAFRIIMKDNIAYVACYDKGLLNVVLPVIIVPELIDQQTLQLEIPAIRYPGEYTLHIVFDDNSREEIDISFVDKTPLSISPDDFSFGTVKENTVSEPFTFTVSNKYPDNIAILSLSITGTDNSLFSIIDDTCSNNILSSQSICHVTISYRPLFSGSHHNKLIIPFTEPNFFSVNSIQANLYGEGYNYKPYRFERMIPPVLRNNFFDLSGMTCDNNGNIYIAETKKNRILRYNQDGFLIHSWGGLGHENGKFDHPFDIKFDGKQYLYVADSLNHRIQKFSLYGEYQKKWDKIGTGPGDFLYPFRIAIDKDDNMYVADRLNGIQKFDNNMKNPIQWKTSEKEITGIDVYEQNNETFVYVIDEAQDIYQYDTMGTFIKTWNASSGIENLDYNGGIAIDPDGRIYVLDGIIQVFNSDGKKLSNWGLPFGYQSCCFEMPMGMAFDWSNNKKNYISDWGQEALYVLNKDGQLLDKWSNYGERIGEFNQPTSIALYEDEYKNKQLFVADRLNHRIQILNTELKVIDVWNEYNQGNHFNYPVNVSVDQYGNIYVSNDSCRNLLIFNKSKELLKFFHSVQGYDFNENIRFSLIAPANNKEQLIYVYDRIHCFLLAIDGKLISKEKTSGSCHFNGMCVDTEGYIYAIGGGNATVQKFKFDNSIKKFEIIKMWGKTGSDVGEFYLPHSISVDNSNNLYISDRNHRIQVFDSSGNVLTQFGNYGFGPGQFNNIYDTAIDAENKRIYVADSLNRIQCLVKKKWNGGKAIIVAGGGPFDGNKIWKDTNNNAKEVYDILRNLGFEKYKIRYLNFDIDQDIDNDGLSNDIYAEPSLKSIKNAIIQWAIDSNELIIYLIDHGNHEVFWVKGGEETTEQSSNDDNSVYLSASMLNEWIKEYEKYNGKVTLIYDACFSGSFIEPLQSTNRVIITSTRANEKATMAGSGRVSFSYQFWRYISHGLNIGDSFKKTKEVMSNCHRQTPCIETNANSEPNAITDSDLAKHIGNGISIDNYDFDNDVIKLINRKVIIVTGSSLHPKQPDVISQIVNLTIDTYVSQDYRKDEIRLLSTEPPNQFGIQRYEPYLNNLESSITQWAIHNTDDLVLYLIGDGTNDAFFMNPSETLSALTLKQWLDTAQPHLPNGIIVIYDACRAKSFTDELIPCNDDHRILIASTGKDSPAIFQPESALCFSFFFWDEVKQGKSVNEAFETASVDIFLHFEKQLPVIYDPHREAQTRYIGFAKNMLKNYHSSDNLNITLNDDDRSALISMNIEPFLTDVQNVLAVIKTPQSHLTHMDVYCDFFLSTSEQTLFLNNDHDNVYSGISNSFLNYGEYLISIYIRDNKGNIEKLNDKIFN